MPATILALCVLLSSDTLPLHAAQEKTDASSVGLPAQFLPEISESFYQSLARTIRETPFSGPDIKMKKVKKSRFLRKNSNGSDFNTAVDAEVPTTTAGFYRKVRDHVEGLIDGWYGKGESGELSVTFPLIQRTFCSVKVNRYFFRGNGSASIERVESYLLAWDGSKAVKKSLGSMLKPGLGDSLKHLLMNREFFNYYDKSRFEGEWDRSLYRATVFHKDFVRVYSDPDGRGRFVTADVPYRDISDFVNSESALGKYLNARRFDSLPLATGPKHIPKILPPLTPKEYKLPKFTKHALRLSSRLAASPIGVYLGLNANSHVFKQSSFLNSLQVKNGELDFRSSLDSGTWPSWKKETDEFAFRTPVGYLFEGKHPHKGVRGCLYRWTSNGPEGPILVSSRQLLDWTVASDISNNAVALYAIVSNLEGEHQEGDFLEPIHLVKFEYDGSTFKKTHVWSLKSLGLELSSPAEIKSFDANHDGVDEILLTDGHGGDFGREDAAMLTVAAGKPAVRHLSSLTADGYLKVKRAMQRIIGSLSASGPIAVTVAEWEGNRPFVVLLNERGKVASLLQGQGLLLDDLDGDGDLDILAKEGEFSDEGKLVWLEQHE